jgi:hypothetical protein
VARSLDIAPPEQAPQPRVSAATWVVLATLAGTALLLYAGVSSGEWRGVIVSEVQILVVGLVTWLAARE